MGGANLGDVASFSRVHKNVEIICKGSEYCKIFLSFTSGLLTICAALTYTEVNHIKLNCDTHKRNHATNAESNINNAKEG